MRLLLDTHIFLWFITGDERLSQHFRKSIEDADAVYQAEQIQKVSALVELSKAVPKTVALDQ